MIETFAVIRNAPEPENELGPEAAAFILAAAERAVDSLPSDAFKNDELFARAQSLAEALEAGMVALSRTIDRPGQGHSRLA